MLKRGEPTLLQQEGRCQARRSGATRITADTESSGQGQGFKVAPAQAQSLHPSKVEKERTSTCLSTGTLGQQLQS